MKKVYYIGFYSDKDVSRNRNAAPAADSKMNYIIDSLNNIGYDVEIISFCEENKRDKLLKIYNEYDIYHGNNKVHFFKTYSSKFRIIRIIGRWLTWLSQKRYIKKNCINNDAKIIVYHSLALLKLLNFLNKNKKKFILEMEEIYADVINNNRIRKKELKYAKTADSYIFPSFLLNKEINNNKPSVIVHGTYKIEKKININIFNDKEKKIHCVYAGTFDFRKGGCSAAIFSALYLPKKYHMHILGFGTNDETEKIKKIIEETSNRTKAKITYDGLLYGNEYNAFIQSCDIGLSTQKPDAAFNKTSFPSKILSYMSNGLRVVSARIPAIEESAIGKEVYYYDEQAPDKIAKAIMSIDIKNEYNSREIITKLAVNFENELNSILENIK